jgi:uncharacterized protein involved in outer membrane biogenesis
MRRILRVALVLAAVALIVLLALRQVLRRAHVREAAEARLSATLGQPVSIGTLGVSLFPRLAVSGTNVRLGDAAAAAPALAVARILILPHLASLLRGTVNIETIDLDGFTVSLLRDADGRWHVPSVMPVPAGGEGRSAVIERVSVSGGRLRVFDRPVDVELRETATINDLDADVVVEASGLRFSPLTGRIGAARITGDARADARAVRLEFAAETLADDDVPVLLGLLGSERPDFLRLAEAASLAGVVEVDRASRHLSGKGTLSAPAVRFGPLGLRQVAAPFTIDGARLRFAPMTFEISGGAHQGTVTFEVGEGRAPATWAIDSRVSGLDVGDFLATLNGSDQRLDGTAAVNAALHGRVNEPLEQTVSGRLRMIVTDGVIRRFPLLESINHVLRLADTQGDDTRFERLTATFAIAAGGATTEDLEMTAGHVRVRAAGRIGADRSLALRGIAAVSPERSARGIASVRELSSLRNSRGEIELPLTISGTLDAPSFGLDVKGAVGKGVLDELQRRLRGIIRRQ